MQIVLILIIAFIVDLIISDPQWIPHPVILIGKAISFLEKKLRKITDSPLKQKIKGGILVFIILIFSYLLSYFLIKLTVLVNENFAYFIKLLLLSLTLAVKGLTAAAKEVYAALKADDLKLARQKVNLIVGRDCSQSSKKEVIRAVLETLAENSSDAILAPAFYYLIGGVPLAVTYKAVNTLDSMIAYKNEKYKNFGFAAAKIDDLVNYFPARITAILIALASFLLKYDFKAALSFTFRDAKKHPSPNAGYPEAAAAGALSLRFGGYNYYHGQKSFRTYIGEAKKEFETADILRLNKIVYLTTILFIFLSALIMFLFF